MTELIQKSMEGMVPELEDLEERGIFSRDEIRKIVRSRSKFEHSIHRRGPSKADFWRYIDHEAKLEKLRQLRINRLGLKRRTAASNFAITKRIHRIYDRALKKFPADKEFWCKYIAFCQEQKSSKHLSRIFPRALQLHPLETEFWLKAATWECDTNNNIKAARALLQQALRFVQHDMRLWTAYFSFELLFIEKVKGRQEVLGMQQTHEDSSEPSLDVASLLSRLQQGRDSVETATSKPDVLAGVVADPESSSGDAFQQFLDGAIPFSIYQSALKTLGDSEETREAFVSLVNGKRHPKLLARMWEEATDSQRTGPRSFETLARTAAGFFTWNAKQRRRKTNWMPTPTQVEAGLDVFVKALEVTSGDSHPEKRAEVWTRYASFCEDCMALMLGEDGSSGAAEEGHLSGMLSRTKEVYQEAMADESCVDFLPGSFFSSFLDFLESCGTGTNERLAVTQQFVVSCPEDPQAYLSAAKVAVEAHEWDAAEDILTAGLQLFRDQHPHDDAADAGALKLHQYRIQVLTSGLRNCDWASTIRPAFVDAIRDLRSPILLAQSFLQSSLSHGGMEEADRTFRLITGLGKGSLALWMCWLRMLIDAGEWRQFDGDMETCLEHYGRSSSEPWLLLAQSLFQRGEFQKLARVHWSAMRTLQDTAPFQAGYSTLETQAQAQAQKQEKKHGARQHPTRASAHT